MTAALQAKNISLSIDGKVLLNDISFSVNEGEKFAVLGLSGAGKSLLIEALASGQSSSGTIQFSEKIQKKERTFSYDQFGALALLKVKEVINLLSKIYRHDPDYDLIKRFRLNEIGDNTISVLSKGERKRLGVYAALFSNPKLVFLDEPTDGMDPIVRDILWDVLSNRDCAVFLTTHLWEEAETFQDKVALMYRGKFLTQPMPMAELVKSLSYEGKVVTDQKFFPKEKKRILDHDGRRFHYYQNVEEKNRILSGFLSSASSVNGYSILPISLIDVYLLNINDIEGKT